MSSKVSICNRALALLSADPITSLSDGTNNSDYCSLLYEQSLKKILSEHDWNFASKRVNLATLDETPAYTDRDNLTVIYQLPTDFIRLTSVSSTTAKYKQEGDTLLCSETGLGIKYVYYLDDPVKYSPQFIEAFTYCLAYTLCYRMLNNPELVVGLREIYKVDELPKARSFDSQGETPRQALQDSWLQAKYNGAGAVE